MVIGSVLSAVTMTEKSSRDSKAGLAALPKKRYQKTDKKLKVTDW
jgi:hypothetical protein